MPSSPIRSVDVMSTGQVWIRPGHVHSTAPTVWWLFTSRDWVGPLPINCYLIEHERGLVVFDLGQDRASVTNAGYFPNGFAGLIHRRLARFEIRPDETFEARLSSRGHRPDDVVLAIVSHLHQDHIGGLPDLAEVGARVLVNAPERASVEAPRAELAGLLPAHTRLPGLQWETVVWTPTSDPTLAPFAEVADVFGDGSLVLLPTPGHTAGSMSLLVRPGDGRVPLLLVGDLTYDVALLEADKVPGVGDRPVLHETTRRVTELARLNPGLVILAAHDPGAAAALARSQAE